MNTFLRAVSSAFPLLPLFFPSHAFAKSPEGLYQAIERDKHFTVMESVSGGKTNRYTIVGNGINRTNGLGQWVECAPVVQSFVGGIVCTGNSYRVILSPNLNSGNAVDLEVDDGQRIVSQPLGVALYDPESGESAWLAQVTNCAAEMVSSNKVVYRNAFQGNGISASVTYTYDVGQFQQDVTFSSPFPLAPSDFHMGGKARLEILTEFVRGPMPVVRTRTLSRETNAVVRARMADPDVTDDTLSWGNWMMVPGTSFLTGKAKGSGALVAKRLVSIGAERCCLRVWTGKP